MMPEPGSDCEYYGQHGEDFLLHELFGRETDGFYVDIGAFDGIHLSNSYLFERLGWSGVCVEAHPRYFGLLQTNRPRSIAVHAACVGQGAGETVRFKSEELGLLSGVSADLTTDMEKRYAARQMTFRGFADVEVPAITLNALLERHAAGRRHIEFISIDTEGNEFELLQAFDFRRWQVEAFVVEANTDASRDNLTALMRKNGYTLARTVQCNLIFVRHRDSAVFLGYKRLTCRIADTLHPLGEQATPRGFRGRMLEDNRFWATPATLVQMPDQPLSSIMEWFPPRSAGDFAETARLVHVVNLYPPRTPADDTQACSVAAIRKAIDADAGPVVAVNVQEADSPDQTPDGFVRGRALERTVRQVVAGPKSRPLPLLFDILASGAEHARADDVLIYTNSDICPAPHFYPAVRELLAHGFDAITINRRTVGSRHAFRNAPALIPAETGLTHGGYDCFVFRRRLLDRFIISEACVGVPGVAMGLIYNMVANAERMLMLSNVSLTYHFGNDRAWNSNAFAALTEHNQRAYLSVVKGLAADSGHLQRLTEFVAKVANPARVRALIGELNAGQRPIG